MAKAYLGKISALVTANTSDFNNKLNASAKEVRSFAASMQSSLSRAQSNATASLRGIYTEAQKLERALKAASSLRLSFKGFDASQFKNIGEAADQMRRIASAAELVYKPLQSAAKATESLSNEVRNEFQPALIAAQRQAELLNAALTRGLAVSESSFAAVERRVNSTTAAVSRLREASQSVGGIATGQELRFQQRGFVEQTARASQLQQQALGSSGVSSEAVSQIAGRQRQAAEEAQRLLSTLEQIRLTRSGDASAAETAYNRQVAALRSVNDELEREIALSRRAADAEAERVADAQRRAAAASRFLQINQSESALLSSQGAATNIDATGRSIRDRIRDIAALREAEASLNRERELAANVGATSQLASTTDPTGRSIQNRIRDIARLREEEGRLGNPTGSFGPGLPPAFGGRSDAGLGAGLGDAARQLEQLRSGIGNLKGQLDSLPASVRTQFIPAIQDAESEFTRLAAAGPSAAADEIEAAAASVDRLSTSAANASRFTQSLSKSFDDAQIRSFSARLEVLRGILLRAGAAAGTDAANRFEALREAMLRAAASGNFTTAIANLNQLEREAIEATTALTGISSGSISSQLQKAGDIGRGGFDKFSLALNQAAFAIDDFFSATGGLEFKIRAVSNNVTQLAFILGGTAGLFAGLAAVIGGQLLIAYDKFFLKSDEAKRRLEAMNEALSRQKTLAEELSQAYRALADSIERSAMSRAASQTREREQEVDGIRERQRERRGRLVAELDGRVGQREAIIAELEEKLGTEIDRFKRQAIQAQIRKLRADIEGITQAAERGADRQIDRATRQSQFTGRTRVAELRRGREDADRDLREAQLALGDNAPDNAVFRGRTLGEYREALIEFDVALQKLADNAATAALELNSQQARRAAAAQSRLEGAFGDQPSRISSTLDFAASLRRQFFEELQKGNASEEAFADFSAEISKVERVLIQAADAASRFADVLDRQVASLARAVEGDLVSAEGNARRTANRLESQFGPNDPRVVEARDNEQRLTRERQRAERERQRIDQEIEGQRARYEDELLDGRGSPADVERARRIRRLDAQANSSVLTEENRRAARQEADRLRLEQQQAFESRPDIQRLRRRADEGDIEAQRELQRQESAERGRRYSMTPAQRAGEELDQQIADIREYFSQAAENSTGLPEDVAKIRNRMNEAIARAEEDFMRQIAPVTMGLRDSVQNAVMQGPSRAALNASDATTMEGARELNRLLRGDDSAKDVDLVALQKEANAILERIAQKQNPVAN